MPPEGSAGGRLAVANLHPGRVCEQTEGVGLRFWEEHPGASVLHMRWDLTKC